MNFTFTLYINKKTCVICQRRGRNCSNPPTMVSIMLQPNNIAPLQLLISFPLLPPLVWVFQPLHQVLLVRVLFNYVTDYWPVFNLAGPFLKLAICAKQWYRTKQAGYNYADLSLFWTTRSTKTVTQPLQRVFSANQRTGISSLSYTIGEASTFSLLLVIVILRFWQSSLWKVRFTRNGCIIGLG